MNKYLAFLVVGLLLVSACGSDPDPISVIGELGHAEANHDVEAAMDLLAEDAIFDQMGTQYQGKTEIERILRFGHMTPIKYEFVDIEANGNQVTWIVRRGSGQFIKEYLNEATVERGKIVYWRILEEITR